MNQVANNSAGNGDGWLVVWQERNVLSSGDWDLMAVRTDLTASSISTPVTLVNGGTQHVTQAQVSGGRIVAESVPGLTARRLSSLRAAHGQGDARGERRPKGQTGAAARVGGCSDGVVARRPRVIVGALFCVAPISRPSVLDRMPPHAMCPCPAGGAG